MKDIEFLLFTMLLAYKNDNTIFDKMNNKVQERIDKLNEIEQRKEYLYKRNLKQILNDYPELRYNESVINEDYDKIYMILYYSKGKDVADRLYKDFPKYGEVFPNSSCCPCDNK